MVPNSRKDRYSEGSFFIHNLKGERLAREGRPFLFMVVPNEGKRW